MNGQLLVAQREVTERFLKLMSELELSTPAKNFLNIVKSETERYGGATSDLETNWRMRVRNHPHINSFYVEEGFVQIGTDIRDIENYMKANPVITSVYDDGVFTSFDFYGKDNDVIDLTKPVHGLRQEIQGLGRKLPWQEKQTETLLNLLFERNQHTPHDEIQLGDGEYLRMDQKELGNSLSVSSLYNVNGKLSSVRFEDDENDTEYVGSLKGSSIDWTEFESDKDMKKHGFAVPQKVRVVDGFVYFDLGANGEPEYTKKVPLRAEPRVVAAEIMYRAVNGI